MRSLFFCLLFACSATAQAQPALKVGDLFPDIFFRNVVNAPTRDLEARMYTTKFTIVNFWGTWCSPCLPEMDSLAKLQVRNNSRIQVIAVSNDPVDKLKKYVARKPSTLWLVSDTASWLYQQFALNYVGQAAIVDQQHRIIALVRSDSINQSMIDKLLRKEAILSSGETGNKRDAIETDPFAVDSSLSYQFTWSGYRPGIPGMSKSYLKSSFEGRRRTYFNSCITNMLQDIYKVSAEQIIYEVPKKSVCDFDNKNTRYCFDILVKPTQKDSLLIIMRELLHKFLPVKFRLDKREMPVYVLRRLPDAAPWQESTAAEEIFSFSGRGFDSKRIRIDAFAGYLANELGLPVVDETGLTGKYDITTSYVMRTRDELLDALKKLGLSVEKTTRALDAVIIYQ
ncbi:MAG: TIGR03435 family protein [Niastella sp.]|nr:TIGR03435 family protein [Niastella sp.]